MQLNPIPLFPEDPTDAITDEESLDQLGLIFHHPRSRSSAACLNVADQPVVINGHEAPIGVSHAVQCPAMIAIGDHIFKLTV